MVVSLVSYLMKMRNEVEPVDFNTEYSEFGGFKFDKNLYFSSNRPNTEIEGEISEEQLYGWDGQPWLDISTFLKEKAQKLNVSQVTSIHTYTIVTLFLLQITRRYYRYYTRNSYFNNKNLFTKKKTTKRILKNIAI